jgi:DNA-binding IclR family transcriptional regulator
MYDNQSLRRSFELLEILGDHPGGISVPELAERTGLHRATIHRLLEVLRSMGYVAKTSQHKRYIIGFRMARFGNKDLIADRVRLRASRRLRLLANEFSSSVILGMLRGTEAVVIEEFRPKAPRLPPPHPKSRPAHESAIGRVLFAFQNPAWLDRALAIAPQVQLLGPEARVQLQKELKAIRRERFDVETAGEPDAAIVMAAPLVNPAGRATCAVGLSLRREVLTPDLERRIRARLAQVIAAIVADLVDLAMDHETGNADGELAPMPSDARSPAPAAETGSDRLDR